MQDDLTSFMHVYPIGQGFKSLENETKLTEEDVKQYLKKAYQELRLSKSEHFICKCDYINRNPQFNNTMLAYLLADQSLLFSRGYQINFSEEAIKDANRGIHKIKKEIKAEKSSAAHSEERCTTDACLQDYEKRVKTIQKWCKGNKRELQTAILDIERVYFQIIEGTEWINNFIKTTKDELGEERSAYFFKKYLQKHCRDLIDEMYILQNWPKEPYERTIQNWNIVELEEDQVRFERITRLLKKHKKYLQWVKNALKESSLFYSGDHPLMKKTISTIQAPAEQPVDIAIRDAIFRYLETCSSKGMSSPRSPNLDYVFNLIAEVRKLCQGSKENEENKYKDLFPFYLTFVCLMCNLQIFSREKTIGRKTVEQFWGKPYVARRPIEKQQEARFALLKDILAALNCTEEQSVKNLVWLLILNTYGPPQQDVQPADVRHWTREAENAISPEMFLNFEDELEGFVKSCLTVPMWDLYTYSGGNPWVLGGYSEFVSKYPNLISDVVEQIQESDIAKSDVEEYYRKAWAPAYMVIEKVRAHLEQAIKRINWKESEFLLSEFCVKYCNGREQFKNRYKKKDSNNTNQSNEVTQIDEDKLNSDIIILKMLILETAFRMIITDYTRDVLRNRMDQTLYG